MNCQIYDLATRDPQWLMRFVVPHADVVMLNHAQSTWAAPEFFTMCENLIELEGKQLMLVEDNKVFHLIRSIPELHMLELIGILTSVLALDGCDERSAKIFARIRQTPGLMLHIMNWSKCELAPGDKVTAQCHVAENMNEPAYIIGASCDDDGNTTLVAQRSSDKRYIKESDGYTFHLVLPKEPIKRKKSIFTEKRSRLN